MTWDTAPRKDIVDHIVEEVVGRPDFSLRNIPASFHYPASRIVDRDLARVRHREAKILGGSIVDCRVKLDDGR